MCKAKRVRLTSVEVEAEIQKARENRVIDGELIPFIGGVEKTYTKDAIVQAKTNGRQHDKMTLVVNPLYIHIPEWQRDEGREKELESILLNNCKGAVYFRNNLYEKWQESLFDFLADVCMKNSDIVIMLQKKTKKVKMA